MITIMDCHEVWKWDQRPRAIKGRRLEVMKMTMAMIFIMLAGTTLLFMGPRSIATPTQSCCNEADTASTSDNDAQLTPDPPYKNG